MDKYVSADVVSSSGRTTWGVGLDRLDAVIMGSNPA
jgi:hypothetical protein